MGFKARTIGAIATQFETTKAKLEEIRSQEQQLTLDLDELQRELVARMGLEPTVNSEPMQQKQPRQPQPKRKPRKRRSGTKLRDATLAALSKKPQSVSDIAAKLAADGIAVDVRRLSAVGIRPLVEAGDVKKIGDRGQARYVVA